MLINVEGQDWRHGGDKLQVTLYANRSPVLS
jgi:hypothetical protein